MKLILVICTLALFGALAQADDGNGGAVSVVLPCPLGIIDAASVPQYWVTDAYIFIVAAATTGRAMSDEQTLDVIDANIISSQANFICMAITRAQNDMVGLQNNAFLTNPDAIASIIDVAAHLTSAQSQALVLSNVSQNGNLGPTYVVTVESTLQHLYSALQSLQDLGCIYNCVTVLNNGNGGFRNGGIGDGNRGFRNDGIGDGNRGVRNGGIGDGNRGFRNGGIGDGNGGVRNDGIGDGNRGFRNDGIGDGNGGFRNDGIGDCNRGFRNDGIGDCNRGFRNDGIGDGNGGFRNDGIGDGNRGSRTDIGAGNHW